MRSAPLDRLERVLGRVLRIGSMLSTSILALGLLVALVAPSSAAGPAVIRAGLLVLLATPVARVVTSVFEYASDRDWLFASLTFVVLAIVVGSLLVGLLSGVRS
jgi:uncharacterized membrane protein